ncbi:MAG TPA: hypothetical protein ENH85_12400 [Candidatus Scalindua sp.]|nr:hypothetical protein [Candidatus Scalindua sp.]
MQTFQEFTQEYLKQFPRPQSPKHKSVLTLPQFWPFFLVGSATLLLSSIRTFRSFAAVSVLGDIESFFAVIVVELALGGGIVFLSTVRKKRKLEEGDSAEPGLAVWLLWASTLIAFLISTFTNTTQTIQALGVGVDQLILDYIGVVLQGTVIPLLGIINLEPVSYFISSTSHSNRLRDTLYTDNLTKWNKALQSDYNKYLKTTKSIQETLKSAGTGFREKVKEKEVPNSSSLSKVVPSTATSGTLPKVKRGEIVPSNLPKDFSKETRRGNIRGDLDRGVRTDPTYIRHMAKIYQVSEDTIKNDVGQLMAEIHDEDKDKESLF